MVEGISETTLDYDDDEEFSETEDEDIREIPQNIDLNPCLTNNILGGKKIF